MTILKVKETNKYLQNSSGKFTTGDVIKVFYIVFLRTKKKKKKMYIFIGLCINKKKNYFQLVNVVKKEKIYLNFDLNSPVIYKILIIKLYKKLVFRVSRIYFKSNGFYVDDYNNKNNIIVSNINSFKFDFFFSAYLRKTLLWNRRKKLRKIRRKYKKTENWINLKKNVLYYNIYTNEESENFSNLDDANY